MSAMSDATPMIARCVEHQHPEEFGRPAILPEPPIRGMETVPESAEYLAPEPQGHPEAVLTTWETEAP